MPDKKSQLLDEILSLVDLYTMEPEIDMLKILANYEICQQRCKAAEDELDEVKSQYIKLKSNQEACELALKLKSESLKNEILQRISCESEITRLKEQIVLIQELLKDVDSFTLKNNDGVTKSKLSSYIQSCSETELYQRPQRNSCIPQDHDDDEDEIDDDQSQFESFSAKRRKSESDTIHLDDSISKRRRTCSPHGFETESINTIANTTYHDSFDSSTMSFQTKALSHFTDDQSYKDKFDTASEFNSDSKFGSSDILPSAPVWESIKFPKLDPFPMSMSTGATASAVPSSSRNEQLYVPIISPSKSSVINGFPVLPPGPVKIHNFQTNTALKSTTCTVCTQKVAFAKSYLKCKDCKACVHQDCRSALRISCKPKSRASRVSLGDYVCNSIPMVPKFLIDCIEEIEKRGLTQVGIYRLCCDSSELKNVQLQLEKDKYIKSVESLDIHILTSIVKSFFKRLSEPILTDALSTKIIECSVQNDMSTLQNLICQLPRPNRDTFATLMIHLRRVARSEACRMDVSNICKLFSPCILRTQSRTGSADKVAQELMAEYQRQARTLEIIMSISDEFWRHLMTSPITHSTSAVSSIPVPNIQNEEVPESKNSKSNTDKKSKITSKSPASATTMRLKTLSKRYFQTPTLNK